MTTLAMNEKLKTRTWLLRGIDSLCGALELVDGRLRYTAAESGTLGKSQLAKLAKDCGNEGLVEALLKGRPAVVFDAPLTEVVVSFPWYYFMGGCKVRVGGFQHRLSFGAPANAGTRASSPDDLDADSLQETAAAVYEQLSEVGVMRKAGKAWKQRLQTTG